MNLKNRIILEDYRKQRDDFIKLGNVVNDMLHEITKDAGITPLGIEHRVKTEASLGGKLERKEDRYSELSDLTDILGARIICFFSDEIDVIGRLVEQRFVIDWENSCDKRALIREDSFGYLSMHYICSLAAGGQYPDEICGKKFEVQIRTTLQHTWAVINHDLGYKSEFGVPRGVVREFSRIAGLLEIADEEFVRTRDNMRAYTEDIRTKIIENRADDVHIDAISLNEYVKRNGRMRALLNDIAALDHAEINEIDAESYIVQLKYLGKQTLGDLQTMMEEDRELAMTLARKTFANADLDILSSTVGLRFLCRAEILNKGYDMDKCVDFLMLSMGTREKAERQAKHLFRTYEKIKAQD